ncbi:hypothetical protein HDV00_011388 [Rhizophlyctis rosea]|nr:hypothetical protein HDV00_011388 [Rhizophlyctis rosea]
MEGLLRMAGLRVFNRSHGLDTRVSAEEKVPRRREFNEAKGPFTMHGSVLVVVDVVRGRVGSWKKALGMGYWVDDEVGDAGAWMWWETKEGEEC